MIHYTSIVSTARSVRDGKVSGAWNAVVERLVDLWLDDYARHHLAGDVVQTSTGGFSYLFDIQAERLIAAWGVSQGRHAEKRDASRMAGHPLSMAATNRRLQRPSTRACSFQMALWTSFITGTDGRRIPSQR